MREALFPWEARRPFSLGRITTWLGLAVLTVALAAWAERAEQLPGAADRSLDFTLGVVLPLLALATLLHLQGSASLRELGAAAARYGRDRRAGVLRALLGLGVGLSLVTCLLTLTSLLGARGLSDPKLLTDLGATFPIAVASTLAYVAWLGAGACFGSRGAGILGALLFDWLLGATSLPIALLTPRGHTRHLLGLEATFTFPAGLSFLALSGLALGALGVVILRVPR